MKIPPENTWLIAVAACCAAAAISAAAAFLSYTDGKMIDTAVAAVGCAMFIGCAVAGWIIRSKISEMNKVEEEVSCLKLKKPGIDTARSEEIVPKGKMPRE